MKRLAVFSMLWCSPALADAPQVVTDIAPVHSLVAMVMGEVAEPVLLLDGSDGPHGAALRPSQARALDAADVVVWMGPGLTPWLADMVARSDAQALSLLDWPGTATLPMRDGFGEHDGHDHAKHDHGEHDHGEHAHGDETIDPHAWLDPVNAQLWLGEIAAVLGEADPRNAAEYGRNARAGMLAMKALTAEMNATLEPVQGMAFAVDHDAFHYLEDRFGLTAVAAHSLSDGDKPGPKRVRDLLARLAEGDIGCMFTEAGSPSRIMARVSEDVRLVPLDPLGATMTPGAALYPGTMRALATEIAGCLDR